MTLDILEKWVVHQMYTNTVLKQGQIKPEIMFNYLYLLKSYHIDHHLSLEAFDTPHIKLIIKDGKKLFLEEKSIFLLVTNVIFEMVIAIKFGNIDKPNIDQKFNIAWVGFLRQRKMTYMVIKFKKISFSITKLIRSDILFIKSNQNIVLQLKKTKTETNHIRV